MTDDYIIEIAKEFDADQALFNQNDARTPNAYEVSEQFFIGAMEEMTRYVFERFRDYEGESVQDYLTPENVENIYITQYPYEPTVVVVEMVAVPDEWQMENADLREFYWHPNPAESGEYTAAYFQPRQA